MKINMLQELRNRGPPPPVFISRPIPISGRHMKKICTSLRSILILIKGYPQKNGIPLRNDMHEHLGKVVVEVTRNPKENTKGSEPDHVPSMI